ncbi:MAG: rhomboid family intramembrane serine protease [Rhizobiaceae bacterium]
MFIPLHDANSLNHIQRQYVTLGLIALNVVVFVVTGLGGPAYLQANAYGLGYTPVVLYDGQPTPPFVYVPELATYVTYSFLHGDFWHLAGNMLFLWVFGDNVEDALGHVRFLVFYLCCAVAGAWFHGFVQPGSDIPLIGASGAVAGIVAAYLILHPRVKVWVLVLMRLPLRLPAFVPLLFWIGFQVVMFLATEGDLVSWPAHLGGIVAGAILVVLLRRRGVPLFDRSVVTPRAAEVAAGEPAETQKAQPSMRWGRQ